MTTTKWSAAEVARLNREFEPKSAQELLGWAMERFQARIALSNSLQAEDMAVLDMMWRIQKERGGELRVFTLDTGRIHQETCDMIDRVRDHYGVVVEVLFPDAAEVAQMVNAKGMNLFYESAENRHQCCDIRKLHPLAKRLATLDAWITGLRREQWATRQNVPKLEIDEKFGGILKLNPIAGWTQQQLDAYHEQFGVPRHALYRKGYTSIGCAPCTRPTQPGEDPRAGRWWWEQDGKKECGLHVAEGK